MKKLNFLSKKWSLSLGNGSEVTRECLGITSTKSRKLVAVLCLLFALGIGNAWGDTYTKATSISAGDVVILVCERAETELTGISSTKTKYGIGTEYDTNPSGSYELIVEDGSDDDTFSFKVSTNSYLNWSSGNSLTTATKSSNSSWSVSFDGSGNATIENSATAGRIIMWNSGSPRFATYSGQSFGNTYYYIQIYKKGSSCSVPTALTKGSITLSQHSPSSITL